MSRPLPCWWGPGPGAARRRLPDAHRVRSGCPASAEPVGRHRDAGRTGPRRLNHLSLQQGLYLAGLGSLAANAVVVFPLLARAVPTEDFGGFVACLAAVSVLSPLATAGLHAYVLRTSADPDPHTVALGSLLARSVTGVLLLGAVLAVPLAMIFGLWPATAVAALASGAGLVVAAHARGSARAWAFAGLTLSVQSVAVALAGLALAATGSPATAVLVLGTVTGSAAGWYAWHLHVHRPRPDQLSLTLAVLRAALRFSVALVPHLVLLVLLLQGVRLVVAARLGLEAAALFQFAATLGGLAVTGAVLLSGSWSTAALGLEGPAFRQACRRYSGWLGWTSGAVAAVTAAAAVWGLEHWLPPHYDARAGALATLVFLPAGPLQALGDVQSTLALKEYRSAVVSVSTAGGTLVAAAGVYGLAPALGVAAGGAAVSAGLLLRLVLSCLLLRGRGIAPLLAPPLVAALGFACCLAGAGAIVL